MSQLVLIADDDTSVMRYYRDAIMRAGYLVEQCETPAMVLQKARQAKPSLILLDIMMPHGPQYTAEESEKGNKTGTLLFRDLRSIWPDLKFIVLTNVSSDDATALFDHNQEITILTKIEFNPFELLDVIRETIGPPAGPENDGEIAQ